MDVSKHRDEKEGRTVKPEDLNPIRDALRFLGRRLRHKTRPDLDGTGTVPASAGSCPKRTVAGKVCHFLGVALVWLVLLYVGIALVRSALEGKELHGASFGVGNHYVVSCSVERGGLLSNRLLYAFVVPYPLGIPMYSHGTSFTLEFADGNSVTVRPKRGKTIQLDGRHRVTIQPRRGETIWVDDHYRVTSLGRVLNAGDYAALQKASYEERSAPVSSPEEFVALVARLRSAAGAAGKQPNMPTSGEKAKEDGLEEQSAKDGRSVLSKEEIIKIADAEAKRQGIDPQTRNVTYDEGNRFFRQRCTWGPNKNADAVILHAWPQLKGRDYQAVEYTVPMPKGNEPPPIAQPLFVLVDRNTGEVLLAYWGSS